jgi:hypothetical protein
MLKTTNFIAFYMNAGQNHTTGNLPTVTNISQCDTGKLFSNDTKHSKLNS